jgi:hypothetical protein
LWPAARAARANSTPMPRPAPVISQVFVMALTVDAPLARKGVLRAPLSTHAAQARRPPELGSDAWNAVARSVNF